MRLHSKFLQDESGIAAIEGAILLPLLTAIGFGVVDTSILMMQTHQLSTGLSSAGTYLSRTSSPQSLETRAKHMAISGTFDPNAPPFIRGMTLNDVSINYRDVSNQEANGMRDYRGGDIIRIVNLTGATPFQGIGILKTLTGGNLNVSGEYETRLISVAS